MAKEEVSYICTGSCCANISEARYKAGLTKCGAKDCTLYGKPFKRVAKKK